MEKLPDYFYSKAHRHKCMVDLIPVKTSSEEFYILSVRRGGQLRQLRLNVDLDELNLYRLFRATLVDIGAMYD